MTTTVAPIPNPVLRGNGDIKPTAAQVGVVTTPAGVMTGKPKSAKAARSSSNSIDYLTEVEKVAKRKAEIGISFQSKKGKQSLFSGVCAAVLSLRGMERTEKLPEHEVKSIQAAIGDFWRLQANKLLNYGRVTSFRSDMPKALYKESDAGELEVEAVIGTARMTAERDAKDSAEHRLFTHYTLKKAKDRMDYMLENVGKFEREELNRQRKVIAANERHLAKLTPTAPTTPNTENK